VKRVLVGTAALLLGVATVIAGAGSARPAGAASAIEVGYWWIGQAQAGTTPAPPDQVVPPGGLWVSGNPSGPQAISAVRFLLADNEASPILTLSINRQQPDSGANVLACPTTSPWNPVASGDWDSRPQYDCSNSTFGNPSLVDGVNVIAFDLSTIVVGKQANIALVPAPAAPPALPVAPPALPVSPPGTTSSFDVTFNAPTESSVATFALPDDEEEADSTDVVPPPAYTPPDENFGFTVDLGGFPTIVPAPPTTTPPVVSLRAAPPVTTALATPDKRSAARVVAALVFLAIAAWWYQLTFAGGDRRTQGGRPRLSLYDDPRRVMANAPANRALRTTRPPALR